MSEYKTRMPRLCTFWKDVSQLPSTLSSLFQEFQGVLTGDFRGAPSILLPKNKSMQCPRRQV